MHQAVDPEAAKKIKEDRYVDDLATGGSAELVARLKGSQSNKENRFDTNGTLSQILSEGMLKPKLS